MTGEPRVQRARHMQQCADDVLARLDLLSRWRHVGDPVIVGSIALDVVVRPDIDIEVYVDQLSPTAGFEVMALLAELPHVRRIRYWDARDLEMAGLYWKVEYEVPGGDAWTIDNWVFARRPGLHGTSATAQIRDALDADGAANDAVLSIKEEVVSRGERVPARWIYEAALDGDVRSYDDFRRWLGDRDIWVRSEWTPRARWPSGEK